MKETICDLNTAPIEELNALPGMTPELAERIQAGRPYAAIEDLKQIQGVSGKLLKKWQSYLRLTPSESSPAAQETADDKEALGLEGAPPVSLPAEPAPEMPPAEAPPPSSQPAQELPVTAPSTEAVDQPRLEVEAGLEQAPAPAPLPPAAEKSPPEPASKAPAVFTRAQTLLWVLLGSGASFVLAVVAVLLVLLSLNGGLLYAPAAEVNRLNAQMERMDDQLGDLQDRLQKAEARLDTVEVLSAQVAEVQRQVVQVQAEVRDAKALAEALQQDVAAISKDVAYLKTRTQAFDSFLAGLRRLLSTVSEP